MYLPAIMMRRWGWPGFLVFAVPNVLGCAAFGYVLRSGDRGARLVAGHARATAWFSSIVVAFHLLFAAFVATELLPDWPPAWAGGAARGLAAVVALLGVSLLAARLPERAWPGVACLVYAVSLVAFAGFLRGPHELAGLTGSRPGPTLVALAPVVAFGFLLCPYLDLTFPRALRRAPSRHAFAVFGVTFTVMIVATVFLWFRPSPLAGALALTHLATQSVFTVAAHLREMRLSAYAECPKRHAALLIVRWVAALAYLVAQAAVRGGPAALGEDAYVRFLVFYALVFPLYVWVFIGPARPVPPTMRALGVFGLVVLACAPFYEIAFVGDATWASLVPLGAFLLWGLARQTPSRPAA